MNLRQITILSSLLLFLNPLLFTQKGMIISPSGSFPHLSGKLIFKMTAGNFRFWGDKQVNLTDLQVLFDQLQVVRVSRVFPHHLPPSQPRLVSGQTYADLSRIYELTYNASIPAPEAALIISRHPAIAYAEPWYLNELLYQPNDVYADTSAGVLGAIGQWHLGQIQAREAWDFQRGDSNIVVGIVDSGSEIGHPDMMDNLAFNRNDPLDGIDNEGDGYIDNYYGWDLGGDNFETPGDNYPFINGTSPHGFAVAGIVGATTDNVIGIAGTSFNCRYLPVKAATDDSTNLIAYGYQGIVYAVDHGAQIVNCSWGGGANSRFGYDVIQYAVINKGAAVIAAAGNGTGTATADQKFYPAAYDLVISVANTSFDDIIYFNSTYSHTVDVSAPGRSIATTISNGYATFAGTSAASPVAAGEVAIILAHFPSFTGFQAAQRMRVTTDNHYEANEAVYKDKLGTGRINMLRAITDPLKPSVRRLGYTITDLDGDQHLASGDTLLIELECINYLHASDNLQVDLTIPGGFQFLVEGLETHLEMGNIRMWESFTTKPAFRIRLHPAIPEDYVIDLKFTYRDSVTNYEDFEYLSLRVNPTWINVEVNQFRTTVNSNGNFGFNDFGANQEGLGVSYRYSNNTLFEGGLLIGNSNIRVSDRIRNTSSRDVDFQWIMPITAISEPASPDFQATSIFKDHAAPNPLGVHITQHTFAYGDPANTDYVIFQYIIHNDQNQVLNNLYAGLFADWDIYAGTINRNACNYSNTARFAYAYDMTGSNPNYYGIGLVSDGVFRTFALTIPGSFQFSTAGKFSALSNIPTPATGSAGTQNGGEDIAHFISTGPFNLQVGQNDTVAFAVMGGTDLTHLHKVQEAAKNKYICGILNKGPNRAFTISNPVAEPGSDVSFLDNNVHANMWQWNFGDGNVSNVENPVHTYVKPGVYTVSLTVSDGYCKYSSFQKITITDNVSVDPALGDFSVQLFPNPNQGLLSIRLRGPWNGKYELSLSTVSGQEMLRSTFEKKSYEITEQLSLPDLPIGIYLIRLNGQGFRHYDKLRID